MDKIAIKKLNSNINYFNFKEFNDGYLITNDIGKFMFLSKKQFNMFIKNRQALPENIYLELKEKMFIYENKELFADIASNELREYKNYLNESTQLHIFVLTTYCNLSCKYCQASAFNDMSEDIKLKKSKFMSLETSEKCVDMAMQSTANNLVFEFQGGEPLANFNVLKHIVEYTNEKNKEYNKKITFNLVSNLTLITDEMIKFFIENNVVICTSIDGPEEVHNSNRVYKYGNCLSIIKKNILKINEEYNNTYNMVQAIQTTTKKSLNFSKEIIDEYVKLNFNSVFVRPLTPMGFAVSNWDEIGYTEEEFLSFYEECLNYIIELSLNGVNIVEGHAMIFLKKVLKNIPVNYMELRSPCGGVIGQLAYNYDGNIYTCDEGRMLAERGDYSFKLGNVYENTRLEVVNSSVCKSLCVSSCLESIPGCEQCVYSPYCGVCPVCNYAQYNSLFVNKPNNYKCKIYKGILDILFNKISTNDEKIISIFNSWIQE